MREHRRNWQRIKRGRGYYDGAVSTAKSGTVRPTEHKGAETQKKRFPWAGTWTNAKESRMKEAWIWRRRRKKRVGEWMKEESKGPVECDQWWRCWGSRQPSWAASASGAAAFLERTMYIYMTLTHSLTWSLGAERETDAPACNARVQLQKRNKTLCFFSFPAFPFSYKWCYYTEKDIIIYWTRERENGACFRVEVEGTLFDLALSSLQWGPSLELRVLFSLSPKSSSRDGRERERE